MSERTNTEKMAETEHSTTVNRRHFVKSLGVAGGVSVLGMQGIGSAAGSQPEIERPTPDKEKELISLVENSEQFEKLLEKLEDEYHSEISLEDPTVVKTNTDDSEYVSSYNIQNKYRGFDPSDSVVGRKETIGMTVSKGTVTAGYAEIIHEYEDHNVDYKTISLSEANNLDVERNDLNLETDDIDAQAQCIGCSDAVYCRHCRNMARIICKAPGYYCGLSSVVICGLAGLATGGGGAAICGVVMNHICSSTGSCTPKSSCKHYC